MSATEQLLIAEAQPDETPSEPTVGLYERADELETGDLDRRQRRFVNAVCRELGKDYEYFDEEYTIEPGPAPVSLARLVERESLLRDDDVESAALLAFPDESLMFIGRDPTATRQTVPLFGFVIERGSPYPTPTSAKDALDLLRPGKVRDAFEADGDDPARQGEWFLLETNLVPVSTVFKPGVNSRPYGPSPLANHIPREYAFTVSDDEFMRRFREAAPTAPESIVEPPEAIDWLYRARFLGDRAGVELETDVPEWSEIQDMAETILVRGSFRHRENEHYMENVGDQWHEAHTHDVDVYTGDGVDMPVRVD